MEYNSLILVFLVFLSREASLQQNFTADGKILTFLQPDDVDNTLYEDKDWNGVLCTRICQEGTAPRICYYRFVVEIYTAMGKACGACPQNITACSNARCISADGHERPIITVNRKLPGPSIQVCQGDIIVVDLKNSMIDKSTTIHWHGIRQLGTPFMDGVPMVTQCPILPGQTFRYKFKADKAGTYFWHSHVGLQKLDGLSGSFIIRQPRMLEPNSNQYDKDLPSHVLTVQDWMHNMADKTYPNLPKKNVLLIPDAYLINGRGVDTPYFGFMKTTRIPISKFVVTHGLRYRFRIISGTSHSCPLQIFFEGHRLKVISADSDNIKPVTVDTVVMSAAARFDVVLEANRPTGHYWITVQGLDQCSGVKQVAVLMYETANNCPIKALSPYPGFISVPHGVVLNPHNSDCNELFSKGICINDLKSMLTTPEKIRVPVPDVRLLFTFGFHKFSDEELYHSNQYYRYFQPTSYDTVAATMNNVSNILPMSPLLTQFHDIPSEAFCSEECVEMTSSKYCQCLHVVKIPLGSVVEIIIVDTETGTVKNRTDRPRTVTNDAKSLDVLQTIVEDPHSSIQKVVVQPDISYFLVEKMLKTNRFHPHKMDSDNYLREYLPAKDIIDIPASGYAITRIIADNPGFWLLHCHFLYHVITGMAVVLQVGDLNDIPQTPIHFPTCGDYTPAISSSLH
ncbi:uncharacterized protein LOC142322763 [Lycorma delicatula]|uniref:uncharacterized protein LOC142322763 n=1 Tax=Lycorma delicatula TaxID=130591 RepID=UPI003F51139B